MFNKRMIIPSPFYHQIWPEVDYDLNASNMIFPKSIFCYNNNNPRLFSSCRRFGTKCGGCSQGISPNDLVRRARSKVFHLNCFTCMMCNKQLSTGEELYIIDENKFVCKDDYISNTSVKDTNLLSGTGEAL